MPPPFYSPSTNAARVLHLYLQLLANVLRRIDLHSIEGESDCILWTGSTTGARRNGLKNVPAMAWPHRRHGRHLLPELPSKINPRALLKELFPGTKRIRAHPKRSSKFVYTATCGNARCISAQCCAIVLRSVLLAQSHQRMSTPDKLLRSQRIARKSRAKLSAEQVQHIRHSNDSHASLARQLHVSAQTVRKIRLGHTYKTYSMQASPFAGLLP